MKPLNLILDYTEASKRLKAFGQENLSEEQKLSYDTVLMLFYPNGEHCSTFPERRNVKAGRKAAKTFMKYCECNFIDKTKE